MVSLTVDRKCVLDLLHLKSLEVKLTLSDITYIYMVQELNSSLFFHFITSDICLRCSRRHDLADLVTVKDKRGSQIVGEVYSHPSLAACNDTSPGSLGDDGGGLTPRMSRLAKSESSKAVKPKLYLQIF